MPGPACYQHGGTEPTVTDANLYLARIDPDAFLGGEMALSKEAAETAIQSLAGELDISADHTAKGIIDVANTSMASAVRLSLFEKGADPSDFVLAPFGGAGGLHACAIAEELDIDRIIFPATASTLSARGILTSDLRHDLSISELLLAGPGAIVTLQGIVKQLHSQANALLDADVVSSTQRRIMISVDCRYRGQAYEIMTPWPVLPASGLVDGSAIAVLTVEFHRLHKELYAHNAPDEPVEIVTVRASAIGLLDRPSEVPIIEEATTVISNAARNRSIGLRDGWHDTAVCHRSSIGSKQMTGPLLIEEDYSALLIEAGWTICALDDGSLMANRILGDQT